MTNKPKKKTKKSSNKQTSFFADFDAKAAKSAPVKKSKKAEPATELMKLVASKVPVESKIKKTFSEEETSEILASNPKSGKATEKDAEDRKNFKKEQKRIKRLVLEMEDTNRDKLIFYKSTYDGEFYKALNTSALYYCYRLSQRMGRTSHIMIDKDRFSTTQYVASIRDIDKFVKQFEELEGGKPEITIDGIYLFPLKTPISDEDLYLLRQTEQNKRDRVNNVLKPEKMSPKIYQQILMLIRQLTPKSEKLREESINYRIFGTEMVMNLRNMLVAYSDYTHNAVDKKSTLNLLLREIGKVKATLTILSETRKWGPVQLMAVAQNIEILEHFIEEDLEKEEV